MGHQTAPTRARRVMHPQSRIPRFRWIIAATSLACVAAACGSDGPGRPRVASLRFVGQPASATAGQPFTVSVELLDRNDERVTSAKDSVFLVTASGLAINGTAAVAAVAGLATFGPLTFSSTEAAVRFIASSGDLSQIGEPIAVVAGAPVLARSSVSPSAGPFTQTVPVDMVFSFRDALGNPVALRAVAVGSPGTELEFAL